MRWLKLGPCRRSSEDSENELTGYSRLIKPREDFCDGSLMEASIGVELGSEESVSETLAADLGDVVMTPRSWMSDKIESEIVGALVRDPRKSLILYLVINGLFVCVSKAIHILILVFSLPIFLLVLFCGLYLLGYNVARSMTYPGFLSPVKRGIEREVSKEIHSSVTNALLPNTRLIEYLSKLWLQQGLDTLSNATTIYFTIWNHMEGIQRARKAVLEPLVNTLSLRVQECKRDNHCNETNSQNSARHLKRQCVCRRCSELCFALQKLCYVEEKLKNEMFGEVSFLPLNPEMAKFLKKLKDMLQYLPSAFFPLMKTQSSYSCSLSNAAMASDPDIFEQTVESSPDSTIYYLVLCMELVRVYVDNLVIEYGASKIRESDESDVAVKASDSGSGDQTLEGEFDESIQETSSTKLTVQDRSREMDNEQTGVNLFRFLIGECQKSKVPLQSIASIDFARTELEAYFNGQQHWVTMPDGVRLDCMFLPAKVNGQRCSSHRTVLFCNPNCGLYEFALYQCNWVHIYTSLGINVFLYNYRGYGRSEGWPTPENSAQDGVAIIHFIIEKQLGQKGWIGVHGESIGGVVVSSLVSSATSFGLSYAVADRTFSDLESVAKSMFGHYAAKSLRVLQWAAKNTENFLSAPESMTRMVTCDPEDKVIVNSASLKVGIAQRLIDIAVESLEPSSEASIVFHRINDEKFYEEFAQNMILVFQAVLVQSDDLIQSPVNRVAHYLLNLDGKCGEVLGVCMKKLYSGLIPTSSNGKRDDQAREDFCPEDDIISIDVSDNELNQKQSENRFSAQKLKPLMIWSKSFIAWRFATPLLEKKKSKPCASSLSDPTLIEDISDDERNTLFSLETVLDTTKDIFRRHSEELESGNLLKAVETIISCLADIQIASDFIRSKRLTGKMTLLPLHCGHNGHYSDIELDCFRQHIRNSGWIV